MAQGHGEPKAPWRKGLKVKEFRSRSLSYKSACVRVEVCEKNSQHEPRVSWRIGGHVFYSTDAAKCFMELGYAAERTSIYTAGEASATVRSLACTEHLAPVFLMWPERSFNVDVDCPEGCSRAEVPMMDGSAIGFFNALRNQAGVPGELAFYDAPVQAAWELRRPGDGIAYGCVRIAPSDAFEVSYILDRPDQSFHSEADVSIYSAEDLYNIFEARTFILEQDYEKALNEGLLAGVDESCGLLIGGGKPSLKQKFRVREEPALHKILDLLGDLAFVRPALPKIRVEILNGGHAAHRQIIEKVINYAIRFRICP
jgi:UDP-3-O-acyl-N-acetylglucosamine deacetylase